MPTAPKNCKPYAGRILYPAFECCKVSIYNSPVKVKGGTHVERKSTGQLNQELMQASSLGEYVSENRDAFSEQAVSQLLSELYEKKSISKAALARRAGMSEVYLHQVFSGRRSPSRIGCSACVWGWRPPWRRPRSCCGRPASPSSIPATSGTPSSATAWYTASPWGRSTTGCLWKMKRRSFERVQGRPGGFCAGPPLCGGGRRAILGKKKRRLRLCALPTPCPS